MVFLILLELAMLVAVAVVTAELVFAWRRKAVLWAFLLIVAGLLIISGAILIATSAIIATVDV